MTCFIYKKQLFVLFIRLQKGFIVGTLFVLAAPSATGKTTLVNYVCTELSKTMPIARAVTYTTRAQRSSEVQGVDYIFIDEPTFTRKVQEGFFIEWSHVYGHWYGIPASIQGELKKRSLILICDLQGVRILKAAIPSTLAIWVSPPDTQELERRMNLRDGIQDGSHTQRLAQVAQEIAQAQAVSFDFRIPHENFEVMRQKLMQFIEENAKKSKNF